MGVDRRAAPKAPHLARSGGMSERRFTDKPCRHGHVSDRYADGRCIACAQAHCTRYRMAHRDDLRKRNREKAREHRDQNCKRHAKWRAANQPKIKADRLAYHEKNRTRIIEKVVDWRRENPDRLRENAIAWSNNRRARKTGNGGKHSAADVREIVAAQNHKCIYCGADLRKVRRHIDHIRPLARGGTSYRSNLQALCATCNLRKHAKDPADFAREIGRLL